MPMPAKNPRINVTFDEKIAVALTKLAKHEKKSVASLVRELSLEALEMREDLYLSNLAEKLDVDGADSYGHEEAWK